MVESGVIYTGPADFSERILSLMEAAGITCTVRPWSADVEGYETRFSFRLSRNKGTVGVSGVHDIKDNVLMIFLGCGPRPLRWYWDSKLFPVVKGVLMGGGMSILSGGSGEGPKSDSAEP